MDNHANIAKLIHNHFMNSYDKQVVLEYYY